MSIRSVFGIDAFDLIVHVAVTGIAVAWIVATNTSRDALVLSFAAGIASLTVLSIRRHLGLRQAAPVGLTSGEMAAERIAELEERMAELEAGQARMAELEERLDFAERLLAKPAPERQLIPGQSE